MGPDRRGGGDERARGGAGGAPGAVRGGACPNLLQRRSGPGPTGRRSAKYQRFFSRASARSGPLQQIRTTCAAVGRSGRCAAVRAEAAAVPLTPKRALRTRKCSSNRRSRVRNAPFDEEGVGRARRGPRRRSRPGTSPMIRGERLTLARILVRKAQYVRPSTASYTCAMSTGNHQ